jgi:CRISPR-associated exonuclease Cas4
MEENIIISNLNDFIFCPRSIYFHNLYYQNDSNLYHSTYQVSGKNVHANIDSKKYSSRKTILKGINVYSEEFGLIGKIDMYDLESKTLIERKRKITKVYDGYLLQVYAQYYCLLEMGYEIKQIKIYSLLDNKNYEVSLPKENEKDKLKNIIKEIREFDLDKPFSQNKNKCAMCIYRELCDYYKGEINDE